MHEDGASTTFRRPSPSYRPTLSRWGSADEGRSYNHRGDHLPEPFPRPRRPGDARRGAHQGENGRHRHRERTRSAGGQERPRPWFVHPVASADLPVHRTHRPTLDECCRTVRGQKRSNFGFEKRSAAAVGRAVHARGGTPGDRSPGDRRREDHRRRGRAPEARGQCRPGGGGTPRDRTRRSVDASDRRQQPGAGSARSPPSRPRTGRGGKAGSGRCCPRGSTRRGRAGETRR